MKKEGSKSGGVRKVGRNRRKQAAKQSPYSQYVRGKITFEQYKKLTSG
jgi:hypothetical protein